MAARSEIRAEGRKRETFEEYCEIVGTLGRHPSTTILQRDHRALEGRIRRYWKGVEQFREAFKIEKPPFGDAGTLRTAIKRDTPGALAKFNASESAEDESIENLFPASMSQAILGMIDDIGYNGPMGGTPLVPTTGWRRIRQAAFRKALLKVYSQECAICGLGLSIHGESPLHAAHIVAVKNGGVTHVRNGLLMCALDHWLFDKRAVWISDDLKVVASQDTSIRNDSGHIQKISSRSIPQALRANVRPDPEAIRLHREGPGAADAITTKV